MYEQCGGVAGCLSVCLGDVGIIMIYAHLSTHEANVYFGSTRDYL